MDFLQQLFIKECNEKIDRYRILNTLAKKGEILFTGSSLMEQFPINELMQVDSCKNIIYNRGIGGYTTTDMLAHMEEQIFGVKPSKIFINIGTNDLGDASKPFEECLEKMLENYEQILTQIKERLPETVVYLMAYYPVNEVDKLDANPWGGNPFANRNNKNIGIANEAVKKLAERMNFHYIDVNAGLTDERGMLKAEFTIEGIHMYGNDYKIIYENMKSYL